MDPTTLLTVIAFAGSAVFHRATDKCLDAAWERLSNGWKRETGQDLTPASASVDAVNEVQPDSDLYAAASEYLRSSPALKRVALVRQVFEGAKILWIDDSPLDQLWAVRLLTLLGAEVTQADSSEEATTYLEDQRFDLVLSDIARDGNNTEGVEFAEAVHLAEKAPLIFFIYRLRNAPPPAGAFGITNSVVGLLHLICDVLERNRL